MPSPLPSSFDGNTDFYEENRWQKFSRRLKEEPLIPFGCALTCFALLGATRSIRAGDHNRTQRMFRARIYAQGFTLVAMLAGSAYWQSDRQKRKEFDDALAEKKAKEKNEAWIRELEARDEEEKAIRAMRSRRAAGYNGTEGMKTAEGKVMEKVKEVERSASEVSGEVVEKGREGLNTVQKKVEDGKGVNSLVEESETKRGVLGSVQDLVWGKKS